MVIDLLFIYLLYSSPCDTKIVKICRKPYDKNQNKYIEMNSSALCRRANAAIRH